VVDVVPAAEAEQLVVRAREALADVQREAAAAELAAAAAERQATLCGADPLLLGRATEQAERLLEHERDRVDAELRSLLDAAADQARARIEEARTEADRIVADARRLRAASPSTASAASGADTATAAAAGPGEPLRLDTPATIDAPLATGLLTVPVEDPFTVDGAPVAAAPAATEAVPAVARLGSVPVYALLQVVALVAVLVVLLAYVS
jgi:hypothetical protein